MKPLFGPASNKTVISVPNNDLKSHLHFREMMDWCTDYCKGKVEWFSGADPSPIFIVKFEKKEEATLFVLKFL